MHSKALLAGCAALFYLAPAQAQTAAPSTFFIDAVATGTRTDIRCNVGSTSGCSPVDRQVTQSISFTYVFGPPLLPGQSINFERGNEVTVGRSTGTIIADPFGGFRGENFRFVQSSNLFGQDGTFALSLSAPTFSVRQVAAVPEPGTWATMLAGFGLIGGALRRSRRWGPRAALA